VQRTPILAAQEQGVGQRQPGVEQFGRRLRRAAQATAQEFSGLGESPVLGEVDRLPTRSASGSGIVAAGRAITGEADGGASRRR